jgi:bifunctional non-homologous end joining protein LigD
VILDELRCPQWDRLQKRPVIKHPQRIRRASVEDPAAIFCFDLLWLDGADFRKRPLLERKNALHRMLRANRRVRYARHMNDSSADIWQLAVQMELEGIVAKDGTSIYTAGRTSRIKTDIGAEREKQRRPER